MIDTLKLSRRLHDAGMDQRQAEELADALRDGLEGATATKADVEGAAQVLRAEMAGLRADMRAFRWQIIAAVAVMLVAHLAGVWGLR